MQLSFRTFFPILTVVAVIGVSAARAELSQDQTFDDDGFALVNFENNLDSARDVAVDSDGFSVLVGLTRQGSYDYLGVARLDADGQPVDTFGTGGRLALLPGGTPQPFGGADGKAVAIQGAEQKIVIAGTWNDNTGSGYRVLVMRLLSDGTPDDSFGEEGVVLLDLPGFTSPVAESVAVDANGNILVGGGSSSPGSVKGFLLRLTEAGILDGGFAGDGIFEIENPVEGGVIALKAIVPLASGKIVAAGSADDMVVVRLLDNGTPDATFSGDGIAQINVGFFEAFEMTFSTYEDTSAAAVLDNGRILVAGSSGNFTKSGAVVVKLTSGGSLDSTFADGGILALPGAANGSAVFDIAPRASGDFVVAGLKIPPTQVSVNATAIDTLPGGFAPQAINGLVTLDDGRIVGGGEQNIGGADYQFVAMRLGVTNLIDPDCTACGELNGDCNITTGDALGALRMAVGQLDPDLQADMDGNGQVTAGDALSILKLAVGTGDPSEACMN